MQVDPDSSTAEAAEFAARAERFVRDRLPAAWIAAIDADDPAALAEVRPTLDVADWWVRLAEEGFVTPTWPVEYGGLAVSPTVGGAISRVLSRYKVPRSTNPIGVNLAGPAILRWGSEEQKNRFLWPIARQEEIWCQMFSEPGTGSDLAELATRAIRDGEGWLVHGQKVWTSYAHVASFGLLLARTDPVAPKHKGLTAFAMPVKQRGVTVRPLRHLTGDAEFNEVFFDDAPVADSLRLGEVNEGWRVAISVLMNERRADSGSGAALPGNVTGRSVDALIRRHAPVADPVLLQRLAQLYIEDRVIKMTNARAAARRQAGRPPGPEGSATTLFQSEFTQRLYDLAADLEGLAGQAWLPEDRWLANTVWSFLRVRSKTIAGGTSEIQRNILGERQLGLPKDLELDRDIAWEEVRRS
jgi:alkylation response protein AidB-like acyl-CoA dehydrogenase